MTHNVTAYPTLPPWKASFIYHFGQKRYPFCIPSNDKWYPFHTNSLELYVPFNYCKCTVFKMWMNDSKTTMFLNFFTALKCICLPFLGLFTDLINGKFPTLPYTSTSEIPTLSYTWSLKMVPFLGGASLHSTPGHKQPKAQHESLFINMCGIILHYPQMAVNMKDL